MRQSWVVRTHTHTHTSPNEPKAGCEDTLVELLEAISAAMVVVFLLVFRSGQAGESTSGGGWVLEAGGVGGVESAIRTNTEISTITFAGV